VPRIQRLGTPHIDIKLCNRDGLPVADEIALVDTGADWSVLPERLMEPLGFTREDCYVNEAGTAGGPSPQLIAHDHLGCIVVEFNGFRVPVLPCFSRHAKHPALGVSDFLSHFTLVADVRTGRIELHPHPDTPRLIRLARREDAPQAA
jgi:predicted aspartyl protease